MIRISKTGLLAVPAVAAAAAVVLSMLPASSAATKLAPRMSAVELANGLLLNQGKAAHYLTALGRPYLKATGKVLAVERSVDHALRTHPRLAALFARDIQSGNRVKVQVALASLAGITKIALDREYGAAAVRRAAHTVETALSRPGQVSPYDGSGSNVYKVNYLYLYNAVAVADILAALLAVLIAAVAVVVVVKIWVIPAAGHPETTLAAERITNLVTVSLQAAR